MQIVEKEKVGTIALINKLLKYRGNEPIKKLTKKFNDRL